MLKIEKVKPSTGMNTDVSPKGIDTAGNRLIVNPILDALNARYVGNKANEFIFESVKGNTKVTNSFLPAGTHKQIGSIEDTQYNVILFWLYNSLGNHGIYSYSPVTGVISKLIISSYLNFQNDPRYLVTGIGIQGDLIYWSDGFANGQKYINRTRDYSGITSEKPLLLIKEHPTLRPILSFGPNPINRIADATLSSVNRIADKNLQFSYQYIFIDNEKSVIAPFSQLAYAELTPRDYISGNVHNSIAIEVDVPADVLPFVKKLNVLVRESNTGTWNIFKVLSGTSLTVANSIAYNGYEAHTPLADAEAAKLFEAIPSASKALIVHRNRVILSDDKENFNVSLQPDGSFPITMALTEVMENYRSGPSNHTYFKRGGTKTFGIALFDGQGRSMGVFGKTTIKFTPPDDANEVDANWDIDTQRPYITGILSGALLAGGGDAKYFSIVCSEDEYYEDYMQVPVYMMFYKYDKGTAAVGAGEVEIDGRVYNSTGNITAATQFNKIHLLLPKDAPIIPTSEYLVRLQSRKTTYSTAKVESVLGVLDSQKVVINNFGITNWGSRTTVLVEIFKVRQTPSNVFYELTGRIPISAGVPSQTVFGFYGDQYYVIDHKFSFRSMALATISGMTASIESPSPTFGYKGLAPDYKEETTPDASVINTILDYSKKDWDKGKPFTEIQNPIQLIRSTVNRFSNKFLPDSSINGLSSFDSGDEYPLPVDRSAIKKYVSVGNNVLAVHERSLSTLYIEQSMITTADGVDQLTKTDRFIGQDREQQFKVGAYNAESVTEHLGSVFGFDIFKGVVWQCTNEGVEIISRFGRAAYFSAKAKSLLAYKDTAKILGGIDPFHKEYVISFSYPAGQEAQNETLCYNWEKNIWTVRYSFVPDGYCKINNSLVSFKDGELWVHDQNALYNNFYGVQYARSIKIAVNPYPSISKNYMALQIATNLLSSGADPEYQVVKCTTEDGQSTYMKVDDFEKLEGVFYGPILKDVNTPGALIEAGHVALRHGDDLLAKYLILEILNDHTTDPCPIQFINVSYVDSEYTH